MHASSQVLLLLVPFAVVGLVFVLVPVTLTRRRAWSPASASLAVLSAITCLAFVVLSVQRADATPGGGAEGRLGTTCPSCSCRR